MTDDQAAQNYLMDHGNCGSIESYNLLIERGKCVGEAFYWSLTEADRRRVRGTIYALTWRDGVVVAVPPISHAVDWLLGR